MILELLNRIIWDKGTDPKKYLFMYRDKDKLRSLAFNDILKIDEGVLHCRVEGQLVHIPSHRIKKIYENDKLILDRPMV